MDETQIFAALRGELTGAQTPDDFALVEPLVRELWSAREGDGRPGDQRFDAAEPVGAACVEKGLTPSAAMRRVLAAGRALVHAAEAGEALDRAEARRLQALVDEAAIQVAEGVERARRTRRQQWLSFLAHEFKNPLNTVLNALWLLRERAGDPKQNARFTELAERAVRRLETRILDMRALDERLATPPPGWEAPRPAS
jgi:signal transduction histidine kinase